MPCRVDFYLLRSTTFTASMPFALQLVQKIYAQDQAVACFTESSQAAQQFDEALWQFKAESFIPHTREDQCVIVARRLQSPAVAMWLTLSDTPDQPTYSRILHIVPMDDILKKQAREFYRFYQSISCELHTHNIEK